MTSPTDGMALLAPDSAWRQWRNAVHLHKQIKDKEETDPFVPGSQANTDRVEAQVAQARAVWLQTMLAHFEQRRAAAHEGGHDVNSTAALKALRVPCKDCLTVTGEKDRSHKLDRDDTRLFPIIASCGAEEAINPLTEAMPTW